MAVNGPPIKVDRESRFEGRVARVTMDFDGKLNIINKAVMDQFIAEINRLTDDEELGVVVLRGTQRAFIGGADIKEMAGLDPGSAREFITSLSEVSRCLRALPVPVIAQVCGYCLGGGLEVAAACDMRIAAEGATFGMPEVQVGIPSVIEAALLPSLIGWGRTRELVYTGRMISSTEALQYGLVERVVPLNKLHEATNDWIDHILSAGPRAIRLQKRLLTEWEHLTPDEAIQKGVDFFEEAYKSDEPRTFMQRFIERRRKPDGA